MEHMKKIVKDKCITLLLLFAMAGMLLAGCGGTTQNSTQETTEVSVVEEIDEVVEEVTDVVEENTTTDVVTESEIVDEAVSNKATEEKVEDEVIEESTENIEEISEVVAEENVTEEVTVAETEIAATTIKLSDFKLLGYSINKDHYEEWKVALGYQGDDSVGEVVTDTPYGAYIICDRGNFVDIGHSMEGNSFSPYISWMDMSSVDGADTPYTHQFYVVKYAERMDLIRTHFSGPITMDMSKDEVKQLLGCTSGEAVLADGSEVLVETMDGSWMNEMIYIFGSDYQIMIGIKGNSVGYIGAMFNV